MNANYTTQDQPDVQADASTNPTQRTDPSSDPHEPMLLVMPIGFGYELRDVIGKGGMGIVYRAYDVNMRREVAVKILQEKYSPTSNTAARFIEEAQITGQLQHPGIPAVYQVSKFADGRPFLAMKLIKGNTLETLLKQKTPINVLGVFESICQAVGYAHAHDVIHRDLKPANIMVGAFGEVQVMDWGLAKVLASGGRQPTAADTDPNATTAGTEIQSLRESDGSFTQAGSVMGTPGFMPPEQAGGEIDKIDQRADVFGLGAILCNLLTGQPPYSGKDAESVRLNAVRGKTEDAFARLDACGAEPDVVALCKQCLAFEPDDRPKNANSVATIVAKLRTEAEERAKQAEIGQAKAEVAASEQRKRRRLVQVGSAVVAVVLVAGIIGTLIGLKQAQNARDAETARANSETEAKREVERQKEEVDRKRVEVLAALKLANERTKSLSDEYGHFVFGIQNKLENRPGTQELRRELLILARNGLKKILDDARKLGNPDGTLVWSFFRMGDVEQQLGNTLAAQKEYQAGYELAKTLADADPKNPGLQRDLSIGCERLGNVRLQLGQTKAALDFYESYNTLCQRRAETDPKNAEAQRDLSVSYSKLGNVQLRLGQPKLALDFYKKALSIDQQLAEANPKNTQAQRDLSVSYSKLGDVQLKLGQNQAALDFYEKSLGVIQGLFEADQKNTQTQSDLSVCYDKLGDVQLKLGQNEAALDFYEKGLAVRQRWAEADPKNAEAQRDLSVSYNKLGDIQLKLGQNQAALDFYEKGLAVRQRRAEADPKNAEVQRDLSFSYKNLGDVQLKRGQTKAALDWYGKGLAIDQRLVEADPKNAGLQRDLAISFENLGLVHEQMLEFAEAAKWFEKMIRLVNAWPNPKALNLQMSFAENGLKTCQNAEKALADIEFVFRQPVEQIPELLALRVKALLKREKPTEAVKTAERFAAWAETLDQKLRGTQRYNAACSFAFCAISIEKDRDRLVDESLALFQKAKLDGYFTKERIAHIKHDFDLNGIRQHPKFVAFLSELDKLPEVAPAPRLKN